MREIVPITIELIGGYTDGQGVTHHRVTLGNIIKGKRLFAIDTDPQSNLPTQYTALLLRAAITEFGTLKMPVPLKALLQLDSIDRDDLFDAFNRLSASESKSEMKGVDTLKLGIGYERNGLVYDVVTFGRRRTLMDEVAADRQRLGDMERLCFLAGRQVVKLSQSEGESVIDGPLPLEIFHELEAPDINAIREAAEVYRQSFRLSGKSVP